MITLRGLILAVMLIQACSIQVCAQELSSRDTLPTSKSSINNKLSTINNNYDKFFLEAMVQRQKGNHDAAFDLLRHCRDLNPEAPEVYYYLGQYYGAIKDSERSMACVKDA